MTYMYGKEAHDATPPPLTAREKVLTAQLNEAERFIVLINRAIDDLAQGNISMFSFLGRAAHLNQARKFGE